MVMMMNRDWATVVTTVGFIHHSQWHQCVPAAPLPQPTELEAWAIFTRDGLWHRSHFAAGRQIRHWTLTAAVFLAWADSIHDWTAPWDHDRAPVIPDAVIYFTGLSHPIALEADTGKENQDQWREKLDRYQVAPDDWHLLVVAQGGRLRLTRLASWLASWSPRPWILLDAARLPHLPDWQWTFPQHPVHAAPRPHPVATRSITYRLAGQAIADAEAEAGLTQGRWHVGAQELRQGQVVVYLKPKVFPRFGRNSHRRSRN